MTDEDSYASSADLTSTVAVRTYFPETWLWDLVTLEYAFRLCHLPSYVDLGARFPDYFIRLVPMDK